MKLFAIATIITSLVLSPVAFADKDKEHKPKRKKHATVEQVNAIESDLLSIVDDQMDMQTDVLELLDVIESLSDSLAKVQNDIALIQPEKTMGLSDSVGNKIEGEVIGFNHGYGATVINSIDGFEYVYYVNKDFVIAEDDMQQEKIWYTEQNCQGQPYVRTQRVGLQNLAKDGQIVGVSPFANDRNGAIVVENGSETQEFMPRSGLQTGFATSQSPYGCGNVGAQSAQNFYPVKRIDTPRNMYNDPYYIRGKRPGLQFSYVAGRPELRLISKQGELQLNWIED